MTERFIVKCYSNVDMCWMYLTGRVDDGENIWLPDPAEAGSFDSYDSAKQFMNNCAEVELKFRESHGEFGQTLFWQIEKVFVG